MIDRSALMNAQQTVTAALLDEGITVVFDADVPRADLRARVMHTRPLPVEVSEDDLLHLRADTDHEMGHFAWSDPDALEESASRPLLALVHNSIEDGFVERKLSARWLGVSQNLARSNEVVTARIRATAKGTALGRQERSIHALQFLTLGESPERVCERLGDDLTESIGQLGDLVPALAVVDSSATALEVSQKVLARWRWADKARKKDKRGKRKDKTSKGSADRDNYETDEKYRKREDRIASKIKKRASVAEHRKKMIRDMPFTGSASYNPRTDDDRIERLEIGPSVRQAVPAFMRAVRAVASPLRRRLLMEFRAAGLRTEYGHTSGELDRSSLHRVVLGDRDLFTRDAPTVVPDADVTLLVDASGSMTDLHDGVPRIFIAAQAAAAFSLVLDNLRIPHECLAFTTVKKVSAELKEMFYTGIYQRVRPLRHLLVKTADQSFRRARPGFVALATTTSCSENVDGEALLWAAYRLANRARAGRRSFLIVFSDGEPASVPESVRLLDWHLRYAIGRIERAGITVLGVGIATDTVAQFYRSHVSLYELNDLVGTSYGLIRQALRSSLRVRAGAGGSR